MERITLGPGSVWVGIVDVLHFSPLATFKDLPFVRPPPPNPNPNSTGVLDLGTPNPNFLTVSPVPLAPTSIAASYALFAWVVRHVSEY